MSGTWQRNKADSFAKAKPCSPGRITGIPTALQLADLERFEGLDEEHPEAVREALTELLVHLDDELAAVAQQELPEGGNSRLAVFRGRGGFDQDDFFVVVNGTGNVAVGRADRLSCSGWRRLEDFTPLRHEVLAVSVTGHHRPLGDRLDLYISTRSFRGGVDETEIRAYHGLIHIDARGGPHLELPADDRGGERAHRWQSEEASRLPPWLACWRFTHAPGIDPLAIPPKADHSLAVMSDGSKREQGLADAVALAPQWLSHAAAGKVIVEPLSASVGSKPSPLPMGGEVDFLTLSQATAGAFLGVVGADSRRLFAFESRTLTRGEGSADMKIEESWRQVQPDFPADVVFLPADSDQSRWPDLLVISRNGTLERLRFVGKTAIRRVWHHLWRALDLQDVEGRLRAAKEAEQELEPWRRALLFGAVEGMLEGLERASPQQRRQWTHGAKELFRPVEDYRVLSAGLYPLLQRFRDAAQEQDPTGPEWDLLCELLHSIYHRQDRANIEIRSQIDRVLRSIEIPLLESGNGADPRIRDLEARSRRNREDVWQELQEIDDPTAQQLVDRCRFGLERWASAYLATDTLRLGGWQDLILATGVAGFTTAGEDGSRIPWLAIASHRGVTLHAVRPRGKLCIDAAHSMLAPRWGNARLLAVPGDGGDRLLVADAFGYLRLYRFEPSKKNLEELTLRRISDHGTPGPLRCLANSTGEVLGVSAWNIGRRSKLVVFRVAGDSLEILETRSLEIPRVSCLDLATAGDGSFWLLTGSSYGGPVQLHRIIPGESFSQEAEYWPAGGGTLALRFVRARAPQRFVIGDRSGFLWCAEMGSDFVGGRLAWLYRLDSAVRSLLAVDIGGTPHVLAASDAGQLSLLRPADAVRVWVHRMLSPIQELAELAGTEAPAIAVVMRGGWLALFGQVADQQQSFEAVERDLESLSVEAEEGDGAIWQFPDVQPVRALLDLKHRQRSPKAVLSTTRSRDGRAWLLRYLACEIAPTERQDCEEILAELSCRELQLLLSYLPREVDFCEAEVRQQIYGRAPSGSGDDSTRCAMEALVILLQRLASRQPSPAEVMAARPAGGRWYEFRWLRLELARVLIHALALEIEAGEPGPKRLLVRAFPHLLELPEEMLEVCAEVLPHGSSSTHDFKVLAKIIAGLAGASSVEPQHLEHLKSVFEPHQDEEPALALLITLIELSLAYRNYRDDPEESWAECRGEILEAARRLTARCHGPERAAEPIATLRDGLRGLLPRQTLPADSSRQKDRAAWLSSVRERLVAQHLPAASPPHGGPWQKPVAGCLDCSRRMLLRMVDEETRYVVAEEVRPFLTLVDPMEIDDSRRVWVHLRIEPEGRRQLHDVSLRIDASGRSGLAPPGELSQILSFRSFPHEAGGGEVELHGFAPADRQSIVIWTTLEAARYRHRQAWELPLPAAATSSQERQALPGPFAIAVDHILEKVLAAKASVVVAVVDRSLGREHFTRLWSEKTAGRRVDLDTALRETGRGRKYSERTLDLKLVEETLRLAHGTEICPVLVAPIDELVQRLLGGEAPGLLEAWVRWLRERHQEDAGPSIVLVVSSLHAAHLRGMGLGSIPEFQAHRLLIERAGGHALHQTTLFRHAVQEIRKQTHFDETHASRCLEQLGGDLHLLAEWIRWVAKVPGRERRDLGEFLESRPIAERLTAELRTLPGFDLLNALVGSEAETRIQRPKAVPGHIAAEEHRSTTIRHSPKLIQAKGLPVTRRSLRALAADAKPPDQVKVEGFGTVGTPQAPRTRLLELAATRPRSQREESFARLARLGIGSWAGGIYRTREPYRTLVRALYAKFADLPAGKRDGKVYGELLGKGRTPLESISLVEIAGIPRKQLQSLMSTADPNNLKILQRIARLWRADDTEEKEIMQVFQPLYDPRRVIEIEVKDTRWDHPLADLPYRKFGVGRTVDEKTREVYPVGYHFWIANGERVDLERVGRAMEEANEQHRQHEESNAESHKFQWTPRVVLIGPGVEELVPDPRRRVAILKSMDFCHAAWEGKLGEELLRRARAQMRLTAISPFQISGPLPPGSSIFFGREDELAFIRSRVRQASILIVGSRRVGKTSLLNQVRFWARTEPDLEPIYIDVQGITTARDFNSALRVGLADPENSPEVCRLAAGNTTLDKVIAEIRDRSKLPILLLNEIDGLSQHKKIVGKWRALSDSHKARFVMVAYSTVGQLGKPDSPFFHWTVGSSYNGSAIAPTALSPEAAEELLGLFTGPELGLRWASAEEQTLASARLLDRSYRIPWVLQYFGQLLLQRLEAERRGVLSLDDVDTILEGEGDVVWRYIDALDYESLGSRTPESARRPGYQLVLFCLARQRYFLGDEAAAIRDPRLHERSPLYQELGFTLDEARELVKSTVSELLIDQEITRVGQWFDRLELDQALRLLTLTLTLEADPAQAGRYGFLMHILPRELSRKYGHKDPTLDNLIVNTAVNFLRFVD